MTKKEVLFEKILEQEPNICYDALEGKFVDAFERGILDPVKTIRQSLQNAASAVSTLITSDYAVVEK